MSKKSSAWKKWIIALMVLGVGGISCSQMGGETAHFAKTVLEIDVSQQLTEEEKESIFQAANRYGYCLKQLRSLSQ